MNAERVETAPRPAAGVDQKWLAIGLVGLVGGVALLWASVPWPARLAGLVAALVGFVASYRVAFPRAWAVTKKEVGSYFNSAIAYIVVTIFLLLIGSLFFFLRLYLYNEATLRGLFEMAPWAFIFFGPAISMRLVAEERKTGTLELLVTMPVRDWEVVAGKFLGALFLLMVGVALTGVYAITVAMMGDVDPGPIGGGYLGLLLLGATFTAIGLLASSLTSNQIIAFIVSMGICLFLWIIDDLRAYMSPRVSGIIEYISVASHHRTLARGIIDVRDIVYYLSVIGLCLYVSKEALASRRWK